MNFAKVRVVRQADGDRFRLAVEVSSDGGQTWAELATAASDEERPRRLALRTSREHYPTVECEVALIPELGGSIELDRVAGQVP